MMFVMGTRIQIRLEVNSRREGAQELADKVLALDGERYRAIAVPIADGCHTLRTPGGTYYGAKSIMEQLKNLEAKYR